MQNASNSNLRRAFEHASKGNEQGQTVVEYSLVLVLVSTAVIFALTGFGADLVSKFEAVISGL
jgi:Flp pilus assembly pilin Flp